MGQAGAESTAGGRQPAPSISWPSVCIPSLTAAWDSLTYPKKYIFGLHPVSAPELLKPLGVSYVLRTIKVS